MAEMMMIVATAKTGNAQGINSIQIGASVLQALEDGRGPIPLAEVARRSGLHPAKVHRYLTSLVRCGLASQSQTTGFYDLGPASRQLGIEALRRTDAVALVSEHTVKLRDRTGHTANLSVWTEHGPTLVRRDTGIHTLAIVLRVGSTLPLLDSAVGLAFLANLPRSSTAEVLKLQQSRGDTRRAPAAEVAALKDEVKRAGYAQTRNHVVFGLAGLAAPVFGAEATLAAVIGLNMPARLMTARESQRLSRVLVESANQASLDLGFRNAD
jgi:DNA-binding IclR family transcriptional regulator